ncbi:MAG: hypothetical protein CMH83_22035 [Nocardioides sp.]|nr:hypothetical protein [Nocardioides sp.]
MSQPSAAVSSPYPRAAALFREGSAGLSVPDLDLPVPSCPGWTVSDVVAHVGDAHEAGLADAGVTDSPADLLLAWEQHLLAHPCTEVLALDLALHAWDLGLALERPVVLDEPLLDFLETFAMEAGDRLRADGAFAPVDPPAGADRATRVLAAYGRVV